jgi:presenilin-like A22 family membrane protease
MTKNFLLGIFAVLVVYTIGACAFSAASGFDDTQNLSLSYSGILATLNIIAAYFIIKFSINKGQKEFGKIFVTGMIIRVFLILLFIFFIIKNCPVDNFVFIISLFILYFIYQIWEVVFLNSNFKMEK